VIDEDEARRIDKARRETVDPSIRRWLSELLADRRERRNRELEMSRRLHTVRQRLQKAAEYVDGLVEDAYSLARSSEPTKVPCPVCGAPVDIVGTTADASGPGKQVMTYDHSDGRRCLAR
jgi:DNA repair exonuclease SbcCD ATPase subunit